MSIPVIVPILSLQLILSVGGLFGGSFELFYTIPRNVSVLYDTTVLYTEADQWGGYLDSTQERHWRIGGRYGTMLAPNRQSFNLEFEFANSATWEGLGDGDLISISSSLYN